MASAGPELDGEKAIEIVVEETVVGRRRAVGSKNINIFRVPDYLKSPDHLEFEPKEWRFGLHTMASQGLDIFKVEVARILARGPEGAPSNSSPIPSNLMASETWQALWEDIQLELENAEAAYGGRTPPEDGYLHPPAALLAIDALFLCAFMHNIKQRECWGYRFRWLFRDSRFEARRYPFYRDLLILDNQVPMPLLLAVIRHLTKAEASRDPDFKKDLADADLDTLAQETLNGLLLNVVACVYPFNHGVELDLESGVLSEYLATHFSIRSPDTLWKCDHILACAYLAICGGFKPEPDSDADKQNYRNRYRVPSATSLRKSGVKFKVTEASLRLETIKFDKHSVTLLLPKLVMDDHTASRFRNLALYEQLQQQTHARPDFRTYLLLMSSLVDNAQDVRLLIESNVLVNHLSNDEAAARVWNDMCVGLFIPANPPKYWTELQKRVRKHEEAKHNKWTADFRTAHCADPWKITAFALACLLTVATLFKLGMDASSYNWG